MKYRISEVSRIVDMPVDTIRYYVKRGYITPKIQEKYHYYDAWDINYLFDYKKYRNLEFSMRDIKDIFYQDNLESFQNRFQNLQAYYEFKANYYKIMAEKNQEYLKRLEEIPSMLDKYKIVEMPDMYYRNHRHNHEYELSIDKSRNLKDCFEKYYGFVEGLVVFEKDNVFSNNPKDDYEWLTVIKADYLNALEHNFLPKSPMLKKSKALYTVLYAKGEGTFNVHLLDSIKNYIARKHYKVTRNIYGILLSRVHDGGEFRRYIGFWIPIEY